MQMVMYKDLKQGECFSFSDGDLIYIRCRGGFRLGRGSELYRPMDKNCIVIKYNP